MKFRLKIFLVIIAGIIPATAGFFLLPMAGVVEPVIRILCSLLVLLLGFSIFLVFRFRSLASSRHQNSQPLPGSSSTSFENLWLEQVSTEINEVFNLMNINKMTRSGPESRSRKFYLTLGPRGSGKSTLVENSGLKILKFPGEKSGAETENFCNWHIARDSLFIEVPDRLHNGANPSEPDEYSTYLKVLKQKGRDKCLDGIIVTVSLKEFTAPDNDMGLKAEKINQQIYKALATVELDLPVYICFTNLDVLPGFKEYFSSLKGVEREQVLGASFNIFSNSQTVGERFNREFDRLGDSIHSRIISFIHSAGNKKTSQGVFQFPAEFISMKSRLASWLEGVFKTGVQKENAHFRGFFFTSVLESESRGLDVEGKFPHLQGEAASQTIISHPLNPGRNLDKQVFLTNNPKTRTSYFTGLLFRGIFKNDTGLARYARYRKRKLTRNSGLASTFLLLVVFILSIYSVRGYLRSTGFADGINHKIFETVKFNWQRWADFKNNFQMLGELGSLIDSLENLEKSGASWNFPPGYYQGHVSFEQVKTVYYHGLSQLLTEPALAELKGSLYYASYYDQGERSLLYSDLMLYLSLTDLGFEHREKMDTPALVNLLTLKWTAVLKEKITDEDRGVNFERNLEDHANRYIRDLIKGELSTKGNRHYKTDKNSLARARNELREAPTLSGLYSSLEMNAGEYPDITLEGMGVSHEGLLTAGAVVKGFYTLEAFKENALDQVKQAVEIPFESDWVMGEGKIELPPGMQDRRRLERELLSLYYQSYIQAWKTMLDSLSVKLPPDPGSWSGKFRGFASTTRGLPALLTRVLKEVNLVPEKNKQVEGALNRKLKNSLAGKLAREKFESRVDPRKEVRDAFADVKLLRGGKEHPGLMKYYLEGIESLGDALGQIALEDNQGSAALGFLQQIFLHKPANPLVHCWAESEKILEQVSDETRTWLKPLLQDMLLTLVVHLKKMSEISLEKSYKKEIYEPYAALFKGRYPFDKKSPREIHPGDINRFFNRDNGVFHLFYENNLKPFISENDGNLELRQWKGISMNFTGAARETFIQGVQLSNRVFQSLGREARQFPVEFFLGRPENSARAIFSMAGKSITADKKSGKISQQITWPSPPAHEGAGLEVVLPGDRQQIISTSGPWAIFRLLEKARTFNTYQGGFRAAFRMQVEGKYEVEAVLEGKLREIVNPFTQGDFYRFEAAPVLLETEEAAADSARS